MLSHRNPAPESRVGTRRSNTEVSPFNDLASDYDTWFEEDRGGILPVLDSQ